MEAFIAAVVIFGFAFLSMSLGMLFGGRCPTCSCKAAKRIMGSTSDAGCSSAVDGHNRPEPPPNFVNINSLTDHAS